MNLPSGQLAGLGLPAAGAGRKGSRQSPLCWLRAHGRPCGSWALAHRRQAGLSVGVLGGWHVLYAAISGCRRSFTW